MKYAFRQFAIQSLTTILIGVFSISVSLAQSEDFAKEHSFVQKYCASCHGSEVQEADRRFDELLPDRMAEDDLELWTEILDRLNVGDMPPEDAELQPDDAERIEMVELLTRKLAAVSESQGEKQTVLRRLNRSEYDAAMRQVLGLEEMLADPTSDFTPDQSEHHFVNIGQSLVLSDFLLTRYLEASQKYLEAAGEQGGKKIKTKTWTFAAPFCRSMPNPDGQDRPGEYQHLRENPTDRMGYVWLNQLKKGVPASGKYRVRVRASAINRNYALKESIIKVAKEDPLRLAIVATDTRAGDMSTNNPTDRWLAEFDVPDDEPGWLEAELWLDKHYQPRFAFPNGPVRIKYMRHRLMSENREFFPKFLVNHVHVFSNMHPDYDKETGPKREKEFLDQQEKLKQAGKPYDVFGTDHRMHTQEAWLQFYSEYVGPRIRIHEVSIEGPLDEATTPVAHQFFPKDKLERDAAEKLISQFATRAWRRSEPIGVADTEVFSTLYQRSLSAGEGQLESLQIAYQAILCSPEFLYHRNRTGQLNDTELASRLSFFLWGTAPDNELLGLAAAGELSKATVLRQQTERLLDDPRRKKFIESFLRSWLQLSKLGTMLPDRTEHPVYFNERLEDAMRTETQLYFDDAIQRDAPARVLVDSDYSFINSSLARLYKIEGVSGHEFQKVKLHDRRRGGLLGQASVLTASANGIDTSPVVRGMWVLECLLGTPPPPPPPDIEPIEPDIRGTTTIREQLAAHREVATCKNCHRHIDPPGFALESFDEIGQFRTHYDSGGWRKKKLAAIDPSGELSTGGSFSGIEDLKKVLMGKMDLVESNLVSKLLTQATGRIDDSVDKATVLEIMKSFDGDRPGIRTLIHKVVQSPAFRK